MSKSNRPPISLKRLITFMNGKVGPFISSLVTLVLIGYSPDWLDSPTRTTRLLLLSGRLPTIRGFMRFQRSR